jgi:hypothetical protein
MGENCLFSWLWGPWNDIGSDCKKRWSSTRREGTQGTGVCFDGDNHSFLMETVGTKRSSSSSRNESIIRRNYGIHGIGDDDLESGIQDET